MQQQAVIGRAETKAARPEKKSLTVRAWLNAAASTLDFTAKLVVNLLVKPVLVHALGASQFGVWEMLDSLAGYMEAADGRPTNALKWVMARQHSTADAETNRQSVASALAVWVLFLPLMLIVAGVMVWAAPHLAHVAPADVLPVRIACGLLALNMGLLGATTIPGNVLHGMNMAHRRMGLVAGLNILGGVLFVASVRLGLGLQGLAVAELVLTAVSAGVLWHIARQCIPWFGLARPSREQVRSFMGVSLWCAAWTLVTRLLTECDVVLLGALASAASVTAYVITSYAARSVLSAMMIALGAVTPGIGKLVGEGEFERAAAVRSELLALTWVLTTAAGATILFANRSFLTLWMGPGRHPGMWIDVLVVLAMTQFAFIHIESYIINVTLKLEKKVALGAVAVVVAIALAFVLIPRMGIPGVVLSMIGGRLVLTFGYPVLARRFLQAGSGSLSSLIRPALASGALFALAAYLGQRLPTLGWVAWAASTLLAACLFGGGSLVLGLSTSQRFRALERLKAVRRLRNG